MKNAKMQRNICLFALCEATEGAEHEGNTDCSERDHNDPNRCYGWPAEVFGNGTEHAILEGEAEARGGVQHAGGRSVFAVLREMHIIVLGE